ncbi:unnamed protein product, partial [Cylicocyclus nassatus]
RIKLVVQKKTEPVPNTADSRTSQPVKKSTSLSTNMILFLISFLLFPIFTTSVERKIIITIHMQKCVQPRCGRECLEAGFLGSRCEGSTKCQCYKPDPIRYPI